MGGKLEDDETAVAFILVIAAGLATAIGAGVVFSPKLVSLANRKTLAISLGAAAGVMLYISLVDIYGKAITGFEDEGHSEEDAFIYATLASFGGCMLMLFLNWLVEKMMNGQMVTAADVIMHAGHNDPIMDAPPSPILSSAGPMHYLEPDPAKEIDRIHEMAKEMVDAEESEEVVSADGANHRSDGNEAAPGVVRVNPTSSPTHGKQDVEKDDGSSDTSDDSALAAIKADQRPLMHMGFVMALAIAIHNFPEGLVTFVSYVDDPTVGIALAVGIAVHNIPEGLCVAMPIYYATGRRWYAFGWGILSGVSEPIGALIGWGIFSSTFSGNAYGIVFGLVSGMMTVISIDELFPTAQRYCPDDSKIVTYSFLFGAFAIASSLMLFSV